MGNGNNPTQPGTNPTPGGGGGGTGSGTKPGSGGVQPGDVAQPPQPKRLLRAAGTGGFIGGLIGGLIGACICCFMHH